MRLFLAAVALLAARPALAAQAIAVSVEELARSSDAVVRGVVASARSHLTSDGRRIFTSFEVQTRAVWHGRAPAIARVVVPGGVVGAIEQRLDAAPSLNPGEQVVVFLRRAPGGAFGVNGLAQGKFGVVGSAARADVSQLRFVRTDVHAGERRVEDMPLAELERRVRSIR